MGAVSETLKSTYSVVFKVEFLQLDAVVEAVHFENHVFKKIDLNDVLQIFEGRRPHESQVVLLQKDVREIRTELLK